MILVDANILVRLCNRDDALYKRTLAAVFSHRQTDKLVVGPQSLYEFWAVATRDPTNNGLGMNAARARRWINRYLRLFQLVHEPANLLGAWTALVETHDIRGFRAHDARYVALMQVLGIDKLMTLNPKHFKTFAVTVINPAQT
jgi:predicted nucleic acid-binding protein